MRIVSQSGNGARSIEAARLVCLLITVYLQHWNTPYFAISAILEAAFICMKGKQYILDYAHNYIIKEYYKNNKI